MRRRWVVLALVFLGIVICYIDRGNLSVAAPAMMREFAIPPSTMGVLLSAFFWTYGFFQIPAGAVVDRFGIKRAYAGGFLIWSLASAAIALSRGVADVAGLRMVLGLAESIAPLASIAFIRGNFSGKDQGLPTSIYIAGQNIGPAFGALVGAMLLDRFGWRVMFALTGLGALVWLPGWLAAAPSGAGEVHDTVPGPGSGSAERRWTWSMLLANRTFWAMSLSILLSSYYWYFVLTWVPSYVMLARGFSTLGMGKVVSTALFTMAAVNVLGGLVVDRVAARVGVFRARLMFAVCGYAGTAAILLLVVVPDRSWTLPVLTFSMCATGIANSNFWSISQYLSPRNLVGRTIGYLNTVSVVAGAVAPIVTGWILGPQKHFGPAVFVAGACSFAAAICLLVAGPRGLEEVKEMLGA